MDGVGMRQLCSSHYGVSRSAYTVSPCPKGRGGADFAGGVLDLGRKCPLQLGGHRIIKTFWEIQSTSGLWRVSQECPMITICCPRFATARCTLSEWHLKRRVTWTSSMTDPFSFGELLTLHTRMGWGSGVVSSWCFCMKLQFMNIPVALESRSVDVEMDAREVREVSSTWMLREWGEFFDRT